MTVFHALQFREVQPLRQAIHVSTQSELIPHEKSGVHDCMLGSPIYNICCGVGAQIVAYSAALTVIFTQ
jgi:hypothetical protein